MQQIEPLFDFSTNKSSILIHQSQAEISINQHFYSGNGEVRLELLPEAGIYFYGNFQGIPTKDYQSVRLGQGEISSFSMNNRQIEGYRLSSGGNIFSQELNLKWCSSSQPICGVGDEATQMSSVVFHLFNFVDLLEIQQNGSTMHAIEHVDLICDQWNVELKSLPSTHEEIKKLHEEGGYRLTHIGGIKKPNGTLFSGKDAQECLRSLLFFLSFAKGGWCVPVCAVGFDELGNRVWESWSSPREPWHNPLSWFDSHHSSELATLYPLFMKKWSNSDWRDTLAEVIYWYLSANLSTFSHRGIDASIILTQTGIERLAYEYAVRDKHLLSLNEFKNLRPTSAKFRLLFSSLQIPLVIPKETPGMAKLGKDFNWQDSFHALTEIRNSLVHPKRKGRAQLVAVYPEAGKLGLWYLSMGLLAVCEYTGTYGNILKKRGIGEIEDVPWG